MSATFQADFWKHAAGEVVYYRFWAVEKPKALLVIIHGFAEHGGRHVSLAQSLAEHGFAVAVPDLPGHGKSSGKRGNIPSIPNAVRLIEQLTRELFLPRAGVRRYSLFGHSFGGLFAIRWALDKPEELDRLVAQSPLLKLAFQIPRWKESLAMLLSSIWPSFSLSMDLDSADLSHDPAVAKAYDADLLVHNQISARCYCSILETRDDVRARAASLRVPTLLLCGGQDKVIAVDKAVEWFKKLSCLKKVVMYPDAFHELHHEPIQNQAIAEVIRWLS